MFACCAAREMIVPTSLAVSALLGAVPAMNGKKRGLTSPAIPPTTCGTNSEAGATPPGPKPNVAPAMLAVVAGAGGFVTFEKRSRMPSARMLSPRMSAGASKPRMPDAAINSSNV